MKRYFFSLILVPIFFFFTPLTYAAVLAPGNISTCGELAAPGTYTLTTNISSITGTCFKITSNSVILDGGNHSISASVSAYAITATSSIDGGTAYGTTTIQNLTITGFAQKSINTSGSSYTQTTGQTHSGGGGGSLVIQNSILKNITTTGGAGESYYEDGDGGLSGGGPGAAGGNVIISSSTIGVITTLGGYDQFAYTANVRAPSGKITFTTVNSTDITGDSILIQNNSIVTGNIVGTGTTTIASSSVTGTISGGTSALISTSTTGSITASNNINLSGSNLVLSNNTYTTNSLIVSYSNSIAATSTTVSAITHFIVNGYDYGAYSGGAWPASLPSPTGTTTINSCQTFIFKSTYVLSQDISNVSGPCFIIKTNDVVIDGAGHTLTAAGGNNNYAITATTTNAGGSAYGTTTVQNINISGFAGGINANGNGWPTAVGGGSNGGNGGKIAIASSTMSTSTAQGGAGEGGISFVDAGDGGRGGTIFITGSSTVGNVIVNGGLGGDGNVDQYDGSGGNGGTIVIQSINSFGNVSADGGLIGGSMNNNDLHNGNGGTIIISGTNLDVSNKTFSASGNYNPDYAVSLDGSITFLYTQSLTATNTLLSNLASLTINSSIVSNFIAGFFPLFQSTTLDTCSTIVGAGTYTLTQNISGGTESCIVILNNNITIDGAGYTINGSGGNSAITAFNSVTHDAYATTTILNLNVTGYSGGVDATSYNSAGGTVVVSSSTLPNVNVNSRTSRGGTVYVTNSNVDTIVAESSLGSYYTSSPQSGGSITIINSTVNNLNTNGSRGASYYDGSLPNVNGGNGGTIVVSSSTVLGSIYSSGLPGGGGADCSGDGDGCYLYNVSGQGGDGGSITISNHSLIVGNINANGGYSYLGIASSTHLGGAGGVVSISNSITSGVYVSGGPSDSNYKGGNGGIITLTTATSTILSANGGDNVDSGQGGNGGIINISTDSVYASYSVSAGADGPNLSTLSMARNGTRTIFEPPRPHISESTNTTNSIQSPRTSVSINRPYIYVPSVNNISPLHLKPIQPIQTSITLKDFGTTRVGDPLDNIQKLRQLVLPSQALTFTPKVSSFLFTPLPPAVTKLFSVMPQLSDYLASVGLSNEQDLAKIKEYPINLRKTTKKIPEGVFTAQTEGQSIPTFITIDNKQLPVELIRTSPNISISLSLNPIGAGHTTATLFDEKGKIVQSITLAGDNNGVSTSLTTPHEPGRYTLKTNASPLSFIIEVKPAIATPNNTEQNSNETFIGHIVKLYTAWFGQ